MITGGGNGLSAAPLNTTVGTTVTYNMSLLKVSGQPKPTGTVTFYDGDVPIACANPTLGGDANHLTATCDTSYSRFGERWITAVYSGDTVYAPVGDTVRETINPPSGETVGVINLCTGPPCGASAPCINGACEIVLHAPTSGRYSGMLIFQDRADGLGLKIWPYLGLPACTGNWMTDGVPPNTQPVPQPCGALGGLSGTIYAPHQSTGASDWDAVVNFRTSGLANLQVIAAQISLNYDTDTRFAFNAASFANGKIHLVE